MSEINKFLTELDEKVKWELQTPVQIDDSDEFPEVEKLGLETRRWVRIEDVVAVVADLKGSTQLEYSGRRAQSAARLYEAVTGNSVRIVKLFEPKFVDIQGDGLFALYHGSNAYRQAMCAGITLMSFSRNCVVPRVGATLPDHIPETGLKVGMSAGRILVKKVGVRGKPNNEPVWAGKPVNYATKCAQAADASQLIATESVYTRFENNDYVRYSCGCDLSGYKGRIQELWEEIRVEGIPDDVQCMKLTSFWCSIHGDEFYTAVLAGETRRSGIMGQFT